MISTQTADHAASSEYPIELVARDPDDAHLLATIVSLGMCMALRKGVVTSSYACARLFGPAFLRRLQRLNAPTELIEAAHLGSELDDVNHLAASSYEESLMTVEKRLLAAMRGLSNAVRDGEKWIIVQPGDLEGLRDNEESA